MGKQIFILEDDSDIGFILNYILFEAGYMVNVYDTIASFKYALKENKPDLLLMDVRLPDGNGMDLCSELKADQEFQLPVLMMSADWQPHQGDSFPADAYIAKPFDVNSMVEKIDSYLKMAS